MGDASRLPEQEVMTLGQPHISTDEITFLALLAGRVAAPDRPHRHHVGGWGRRTRLGAPLPSRRGQVRRLRRVSVLFSHTLEETCCRRKTKGKVSGLSPKYAVIAGSCRQRPFAALSVTAGRVFAGRNLRGERDLWPRGRLPADKCASLGAGAPTSSCGADVGNATGQAKAAAAGARQAAAAPRGHSRAGRGNVWPEARAASPPLLCTHAGLFRLGRGRGSATKEGQAGAGRSWQPQSPAGQCLPGLQRCGSAPGPRWEPLGTLWARTSQQEQQHCITLML